MRVLPHPDFEMFNICTDLSVNHPSLSRLRVTPLYLLPLFQGTV